MINRFRNHNGYSRAFQEDKLTLGLFFPLEAYEGNVPEMDVNKQIKLAKKAEEANFSSLFVRDIPLNDPAFGDAGQIYDPWIFLSYIAAHTEKIALGTGSVITSFKNPLDIAKSASSLDAISNQRLLFGIATGDRPVEFKAYRVDRNERAQLFQESFEVMKRVWKEQFPTIATKRVKMEYVDLIPKPTCSDIPTLITGHSGQSIEWIAENGDGWISYPRSLAFQGEMIKEWRSLMSEFKPFSQSLYIDLLKDPDAGPTQIHLGFRSGYKYLLEFLNDLQDIGVNHVILNLKFAERPIEEVIEELGAKIIPYFPAL